MIDTRVRVHAYCSPCDMRKSFNTLGGLVTEEMGFDLCAGDVFLFVSRNLKRAKVLWYDGTGLCLLAKRLDQGRFAAPWRSEQTELQLSGSELRLFLEGCDVVGRLPLSPSQIDIKREARVTYADFI